MNNRVREILAALLAFDTTSRHSNLAMIDWIADFLARAAWRRSCFMTTKGARQSLRPAGPSGGGGVMLSGHTDVVPVDGQAWTVPPFSPYRTRRALLRSRQRGYEGFIACVLASLDGVSGGAAADAAASGLLL
jgi:acetylornithine deacetylase